MGSRFRGDDIQNEGQGRMTSIRRLAAGFAATLLLLLPAAVVLTLGLSARFLTAQSPAAPVHPANFSHSLPALDGNHLRALHEKLLQHREVRPTEDQIARSARPRPRMATLSEEEIRQEMNRRYAQIA